MYLTFVGCLLTAYGPLAALFVGHVASSAQHVILVISSAFFWLVGILFASLFWLMIPPLYEVYAFTIFTSVLFQELFRWLYFLVFVRAEPSFNLVSASPNSKYNKPNYALVSGIGFGLMSSLISYVSMLAESAGPGVIMSPSCPSLSHYYVLALTTMLFSLLHVGWMVISFDAFYKKNWPLFGLVVVLHLVASYLTMLNGASFNGGCAIALTLIGFELIAVSALAYMITFKLDRLPDWLRRSAAVTLAVTL